jgi:hypothetical protein
VNGLLRNGKNCINLTVGNSLRRQPINQNLKILPKGLAKPLHTLLRSAVSASLISGEFLLWPVA